MGRGRENARDRERNGCYETLEQLQARENRDAANQQGRFLPAQKFARKAVTDYETVSRLLVPSRRRARSHGWNSNGRTVVDFLWRRLRAGQGEAGRERKR